MLLVCPDCSHRYRIPARPDEPSRVVRFNCRRCGASIDSSLHAVAEALGDGPGWLVIHEGVARGPYDSRTLVGLARSRAFGPRALVWRDGLEGWQVAGTTPPLGPERAVAWWVKLSDDEVGPVVAGLGQVLAVRPDHAASIDALERLIRVGRGVAAAAGHVEAALLARGEARRLVELLEHRLTLTDDRQGRVELRRRIASLCEQRLGDRAAARTAYDEALRDAPEDAGLIEGLIRTAAADGDWAGLVRRLEGLLGGLAGAAADRLRLRIARIRADELDDPEAALDALDTVETHVDGAEARALRVALYRRLERWTALAALYAEIAAESADDPPARAEALRALAAVLADELEDPAAAAETWATLAREYPEDDDAVERLAALVGARPELDAGALDAALVARGDWAGVYALRASRVDRVPAGSARAGALAALAALCVERLDDPAAAYTWAARAAAERPHDGDYRRLHAELAIVADRLPAWVDAAVAAVEGDPALAEVYVEAAVELPLGPIDRERLHRAVLRVDPAHAGAFAVLRALWHGRPAQLRGLLDARIAAAPAERRALLAERAAVEADGLGDAAAAFATWGEVLAADPRDVEALRARRALAERLGDRRVLAAIDALRRGLDDPAEADALAREAARREGDPAGAITRWWAIVDGGGADPESLDALEALCAAEGDRAGLIRALEVRRAAFGLDRARLHRLAGLYAAAGDGRARAAFAALIDGDPGDDAAVHGFAAVADDADGRLTVAVLRLARAAEKGPALAAIAPLAEAVAGPAAAAVFAAAAMGHTGDDAALGPIAERGGDAVRGLLIDAWDEAAELFPDAALFRRRAAWCDAAGRAGEARGDWIAATALDPAHARAWRARLRHAEAAGDGAEAVECLARLEALAGDAAEARALARRRAEALGALDRPAEAIEAWQAARGGEAADEAAALDALIALYAAVHDRAALEAALAEREALAEDGPAAALAARRAALAADRGDVEAAIAAWRTAIARGGESAAALAALDGLLAQSGRDAERAEVLARRIPLAAGAARRALRATRARLLDALGDADGALAEWDATLAEAPGDLDALRAARALRVERGDWAEAVALGERLLGSLPADDPGHRALLRSQAQALVGPLDRPAAAIAAWSAVLAGEPADAEALDALEALYRGAGDAAGLVAILDRRRALAARPDGALLREIGALRADALGDADGALAAFDAALALDPGDGEAFTRAAAILDGRGDDAGVLARIDRHVAHAPADAALALHAEAAGRAERLGRLDAALVHATAAMRIGADDAIFGPVVERLAGSPDGWALAAQVWQAALDEVAGTPAALPLHLRLLAWARGPLTDRSSALAHARGVLALDPHHRGALETRVELAEEPAVVADALARLHGRTEDPAERAARARRLGALHAGPLGDPGQAVAWFERALADDPEDDAALDGLAALHAAAEAWAPLRLVRLRQADRARDAVEVRAARLAEAARLSARLDAPGQALADWTEVLAVDPRHAEALGEARRLRRQAGDWAAVVDLGARWVECLPADDPARAALLRDQARVLDDRLGRPRAAIAAWRAVRATAPADPEALAALDRLYSAADAAAELAEVLAARCGLEAGDADLWRRLGLARRAVGDLEGAQAAFDAALAIDPTDEDAFEAALALADGPAETLRRIEAHLPHAADGRASLHARALDAAMAVEPATALPHLAAAVEDSGDDARFGPIAERLGAATGDWPALLGVWRAAIERAGRGAALPLHRRALRWVARHGEADAGRPHAEALLVADPDDVEALSALTRVGDPATRADALARLHPLLDAPRARADRAAAVAAVYADELGDPRAAVGWLEAALADRVDDPALLARLADAHAALGDRVALCRTRRRQAAAASGAARVELRAEAARLAQALGDPQAAQDWAAVLADAPDHAEALAAARAIELAREDWRAAASLGDRLLAALGAGDAARSALLRDQARLAARLGRAERAIDLWRALLDETPGDPEALDALETLFAGAGDPHGLLWVLERRRDRAATPSPALRVRIGDLRRDALGDERGALAEYDAALAADPLHADAFDRACAACAALGDRAAELDRVEARLARVEDPPARAALRARAAELAEKLERPEAALRHWADALRCTGDDPRFAPPVERLAAQIGDWVTPAAAWRAALVGRPAGEALPLHRRLLAWARGPLDDAAEARVHAEQVLAVVPDDRAALDAMAAAAATPAERAEALARLFDTVEDEAAKVELARELGALHADDAPGRAARWYEAALAIAPADRAALDGLAAVHAAREAWAPLLAVRLRQAEVEADAGAAAARLVEAAQLAERLGRPAEAAERWQAAMGRDAAVTDTALAALDRLLGAQGRFGELAEVLAERVGRSEGEARRVLLIRRARLCAERLDDREGALTCWRAILADDPDDDEALWAALALSEGAARAALRRRLVERLPAGDPRRAELLRALAREAGGAARARAWEALLAEVGDDPEALDALEALYAEAADWPALVRVLARRVGDPPSDAARLLRIARLRDERLGDPRAAAESYDALVRLAPEDEAAFARLVELLIGLGEHEAALARIERRLEHVRAPAARLALRRQAAELAETALDRPEDALAHVCAAFAESADDPRFGPEAARLAGRVGDWSRPVEAWRAAIANAAPDAALALHLRVGAWAAGPMGDVGLARRHYRAALAIAPEHREALRALAALAEDDPADRAEALEGLLAAERDPEGRRALAVRLGDLYAGPLADPDQAVARYLAALSAAPGDPEALAGLARVHAGRGAWAPLLDVRRAQIEALTGPARAAMRVEMARLAERLGKVDEAVAIWREALEDGAAPDAVLGALDALLTAHRRWRALATVLARRIQHAAGDRSALRALRVRRAGLLAERLDDPPAARAEWRAVLALDPRDTEALWALRALAEAPAERVEANRRLLRALPADDPARAALRREEARLCGGPLDRPAEAIEAWRALLADHPGDTEALDALEALHRDDPAARVEVLRLRHAAAPSSALRLRIGALREEAGDPAGALADYRAVLAEVPDHAEAFARARRLLVSADDQPGLLALIERRLAHLAEPAARRALAEEAARLAEEAGDPARALRWLGEAFATCRDDHAYGDGVARLAEAAGAWPEAIARWREAADALGDAPEAAALHLRLHGWLADDPEQSAAALARAARIAPDDPRVLRAQARIAEGARDHAAMLRALLALRRGADAASTRQDLTRRIARLLAGPLANPEAALAEYTRLLGERPDDPEALAGRADLLRRLDRPGDLFRALGELLDRADDPARRRALLEERAALAERQGWTDEAVDGWRAVLALDAGATAAWTALETLFAAGNRLAELEALLTERAAAADASAAAGLWVRAAQAAEKRGDAAAARAHHEAALAADPDCAPALRHLAALHATEGDAAVQARLEARLAARLPADTPEAVDRWRALGRLCQGAVGDPGGAIEAWAHVRRIVPDDEEALAALGELYAAVGDDAALADVLAARAGHIAERGEKQALWTRVAALRERLGDDAAAVDAWRAAFALDPAADEPFEALRRLHARRDDWSALAGALLDRAAALPASPRRTALRLEAAELLAERAGRADDALRARLSVFAEQPDDAAHGAVIDALAAAAERGVEAAAAAYGRALDRPLPVERAVPLRMRLARWQAEHLGAPEDAIAQYCAVLDRVPDHAEALARMERLRAEVGDWSALASLLQQRVARAGDEAERMGALRRLGRVQARQPEARQAAIATWRRVRRMAAELNAADGSADPEAADALARLYREAEQWPALVRLLEESPPTPARLREIARLCTAHLGDPDRAIDALERARALDPDDAATGAALVDTYRAAGRLPALRALYADLVRRRPPAERPALYRALARLLEDELGEPDAAADAWRAVARLAPEDPEPVARLDRLDRAAGRLDRLAEARARHVAALPAEQAIDARLALADLYRELGDPYRAIDALRPALDLPARGRRPALDRLAALYSETGDWRYCADVLDHALRDLADGPIAERVARLREAARVREDHLRDVVGAFERVAAAWRLDPADEALAADAARLGARLGRPRALLELCAEVEGRVAAVPARGRVLRAMARVARQLGDADAEERAWQSLRDAVDPDDDEALDGLARLLAAREAWSLLRPVLEARAAIAPHPSRALALGVLTATHLDRPGEAAGWYRRVLADDPRDRRALAGLVDIERRREAWPALYHALDRLAETLPAAERAPARAEQAALAADRLGRPADARRLWSEVLELRGGEDPEALAALDRLLSARPEDDPAALIEVLRRRVEAGEPAAPLHVRLAGLHADRGEAADALDHWRLALAADPDCAPALWALHDGSPDDAEVVALRRRLLARLPAGDPRRIGLLRAHARRADRLEDAGAAIAAWRAVRAEAPLDAAAVEALARLYEGTDDRAALADLLAETGTDRLRAARLYVELGRGRTARRLFERVLADEPGHREASEALAELHRAALRWPALVEVLRGRLKHSRDADERHGLRARLADVLHRRLRAPDDALAVLLDAFAERPDPALIPGLDALAAETDGWPAVADAAERAVESDPTLHGWLARIYAEHLEMPQAAIAHARRGWRLDPADEALRGRLEALLTAVEDWDALAEVWAAHAERLPAAAQRDRLAALARLHAERRGDPAAATAVWQDVLASDPADAEALDALAALHRETDRLDELCAVYERRFEQAADLDERVELAERIAELAAGGLGDPARAIGPVRAALDASHRPALYARLAALHDAVGRPSAALSVRLQAIARMPSAEARGRALVALADASRGDDTAAPWRGLRTAFTDAEAWRAVDALLDAVGRWDDRAALATLDAEADGGPDRWVEVARLHGERRRDPAAALVAWRRALAEAPGDAVILDGIEDAMRAIDGIAGRDAFAALLAGEVERSPALIGRLAALHEARGDAPAAAAALSDWADAIGDDAEAMPVLDRLALARAAAEDWSGCHAAGHRALRLCADAAERAARRLVLADLAIEWLDATAPWLAIFTETHGTADFAPLLARLEATGRDEAWRTLARLAAEETGAVEDWRLLARGLDGRAAKAAWRRVLAAAPGDREALAALAEADRVAGRADAIVGRLVDAIGAIGAIDADAIDAILDDLLALADDPAVSPEAARDALEAVHAAAPARAPLDRLATARLAAGDEAGWRAATDAARRAERDPARWTLRTLALADAGAAWATLLDGADPAAVEALDDALATAGRWRDVAAIRRLRLDEAPEAHAALARALERVGDAEAWRSWAAVAARAPGDPEALDGLAAAEDELAGADLLELAGIYAAQRPHLDGSDRVALALRLADLVPRLDDRGPALAALSEAVDADPDPRLLDRLAALRAEAGDDAAAAALRARALDAVAAPTERAARLRALATLRSRAGDLDGAFEALAEALVADPDAPETAAEDARLARLAEATGRVEAQAEALDAARRASGDPARREALGDALVALFRGPLAGTSAAEGFWRASLAEDPADPLAFAALAGGLESAGRRADLAALYAERARAVPGEAIGLHVARAGLFAELRDRAGEAEAWRAVRAIDPRHDGALRALWRLADDPEARDGLARALLARAPTADPLRVELHRWLAPRSEGRAAAEHWRAVLAADPDADEAAEALLALRRAAGDHGAVRALLDRRLGRVSGAEAEAEVWRAIAEVEQARGDGAATRAAWRAVLARRPGDPQAESALADAHLAADDVEAWAALRLERLDGIADPAARLELYREVAATLEARLPDPGPAFEVLARAFAERPHDGALADELARLAGGARRWSALSETWRAGLASLEGRPALALALRLADLEAEHGAADAAAAAWRRALAVDPRCVPALDGLERHAVLRGDDRLLAEVLAARLRTPLGEAEALDRWRRLARLRAAAGEAEGAEAAWSAVLQRRSDDPEALAALDALYSADEAWRPLTEVLLRRLVAAEGEAADALRMRLADVALNHLGDRAMARAALSPIAEESDDPAVLGLLVELCRADADWPACAAALDRQARRLRGRAARDAWMAKAAVERDHLGDARGAMASLGAAAELDPRHAPALVELWRLAEAEGDAPAAARALVRLEPLGTPAERAERLTRLGALCADALGDPAGAVEAWEQALAAVPDHGPALRRLADHALAARRWPEAAVLLDRLLAAEPEAEAPLRRDRHVAAARCAEAMEDEAAAARHYEAALALDGTHRGALEALADLAFRLGDWGRAFKVGHALSIHHGEALEPAERADRLHRLGALKALLGEPARAGDFYAQALEAHPGHGPSRRALDALRRAEGAAVEEDPSWIGEADLLDAEDAALEAYLWGDGPAPTLDAPEGEADADAAASVEEAPRRRRETAAYASPVVQVQVAADAQMESAVERAMARPLEDAVERIVRHIGERPVEVRTDDPGIGAAAKAAESAAEKAAAAARAAEAAAEAAHAGAAAMSAVPLAALAQLEAPGGARERAPAKPMKAQKVRVLRRTSPRRRYLYQGLAAAVLVAGAAVGLLAVQSWRLEATAEDNARLTRVSQTLARKVSETQVAFDRMARELRGDDLGPGMPEERQIALFDEDGQPLDEVMLELAFRDLEMREELGTVRDVLARADQGRAVADERSKALEEQIASMQAKIDALRSQQGEVHERLAGRLDQNIQAIETALTATGIDFDALVSPELGKAPVMVAGVDDQQPMTGVGGPFIAEGTSDYVNPIPGETEVMSGFGPRGHSHHNGIDIPAPIGTAVLAVTGGEVIFVQDRAAWQSRPKWVEQDGRRVKSQGWRAGIYVELKQDDGRISRYMHLAAVAPGVEVGAKVKRGQVLGSVGRSGVEQSETHLHFELREPPDDGGRYGAALDPTAAVHRDDADVIVGTSLLHADPALIELPTDARRTLEAARLDAADAGDEAIIDRLDGRMDRLQSLEKLLREMPLVPPVDDFRVSSLFGRRLDPIEGEWGFHGGIDIPGAEGTAIRATAPGKVVFSGNRGRYGVMVEIDHGNGITTRYGHLLRSLVREGEVVRYRDRIGEMGSSGRSTGTHLHYEVRVDGNARDPMNFIQAGRYVFKR